MAITSLFRVLDVNKNGRLDAGEAPLPTSEPITEANFADVYGRAGVSHTTLKKLDRDAKTLVEEDKKTDVSVGDRVLAFFKMLGEAILYPFSCIALGLGIVAGFIPGAWYYKEAHKPLTDDLEDNATTAFAAESRREAYEKRASTFRTDCLSALQPPKDR